MIQRLLDTIYRAIDADRVLRRAQSIWQCDRWTTASAWQKTAEYVADELRVAGAEDVGIHQCPADGESVFFGQTMWPVWEVRDAKLELLGADPETLCHYRRQPRDLMTFSSPTPPGGIETELVMVDDGRKEDHYRGMAVAGKIVFTHQHGGEVVAPAAKMGAVGVLSDFIVTRDSPYLARWMPALTLSGLVPDPPNWDQHQQWMHITDYRSGLFGFAISRAAGARLRGRLARGPVRVRAMVDAEFSRGSYPAVTGVIAGKNRSHPSRGGGQVLLLSHLYEPGANDNASGCAVSLEVAECLTSLIRSGLLPRPRRDVRILLGMEFQGPAAYLHAHKEQIAKTVAGLCVDGVGADVAKAQTPMCVSQNPKDRPAFTDPLLEWLTHSWLDSRDAAYPWISLPYDNGTDNFIAETAIGIPCPWLGQVERVWHTTADIPDILDRRSLTHAAVLSAAYCYYLAAAGPAEVQTLLDLTERYGRRRLLDCADQAVSRILEQKRGGQRQLRAGIASFREERERCLARLDSVLSLVHGRGERAKQIVAAARSRLRSFALREERALRALASKQR